MSRLLKGATGRGAIAALGGGVINGLLRTVRFEVEGREHYDRTWGAGKPVLFALWHGRLLPCSYYHRGEGLATLISQHRDGDYIAAIVEGWGFTTIRGSSSRGGTAALRQMVKTLGRSALAVTPDGPRGPREKVKPGLIAAAQLAGAPIIPVSAGTDRAWWFEGWDRFLVPKPFATIRLRYGAPIEVPAENEPDSAKLLTKRVEDELNRLTELVDER